MNMLKVENFKTIFSYNFLLSIAFFITMFFLTKGNDTSIESYISVGVVGIGFLSFIGLYIISNYKLIINVLNANNEITIFETLGYYFSRILTVFVVFLLSYNYLIPLIGDITNNFLSLNILDIEFNVLTTFLTLVIGFWFFTSSHIILIHDCTVMESFKEIFQFITDDFIKAFFLLLSIIFLMFLFQLILVSTFDINQLTGMPLKVISFAYIWMIGNNFITKTYISSYTTREED